MSVRPIVLLGDPRLRLKGLPVDSFGKYLHELLDDLAAHDARRARRRARRAAARRGAAGLRHRGRGPAPRAGEPADRPGDRRRPRPRGLPVDPGLRRLRDPPREASGSSPRTATARRSRSPAPGCSGARSSTSSTTSTASSTSTTSTRWTSCCPVGAATRTTRRSARRRAPSRDRRGEPAARACGPSSSGAARSASRPCGASPLHPDVELVGVVTAPARPAGRAGWSRRRRSQTPAASSDSRRS